MDQVFECFCDELEKRAISAALMGRALAGRAAQGVGGAAALGRQVTRGVSHGLTNSRQIMAQAGGLGKAQLSAVTEGGVAARRTQAAFAGPQAALKGRIQKADAMGAGAFSQTPLKMHDALGNTHAYSKAHLDTVAGSSSRVLDPKGVMATPARKPVVAGTEATQIAPTVVGGRTQVGQIGGRNVPPPKAAPSLTPGQSLNQRRQAAQFAAFQEQGTVPGKLLPRRQAV